jgi:chromate reductase
MTRILGISGSLREGSFNSALLRAGAEQAPEGVKVEIASIDGIPLFNQDVEKKGIPGIVTELAEAIRAADGLWIATPEYNYSVPGVLKNAIDWVSRVEDQPFKGKPIAIMGASMGRLGTARSQYHLRQVMVFVEALVMNKPEIFAATAQNIFEDGKLVDETTRELLEKQLEAFVAWIDRVSGKRKVAF